MKRCIAMLACVLVGCQSQTQTPTGDSAEFANPFAPASMQIHPLTHFRNQPERMIVLHLELRDAWGEMCKGVGSAVVELYRPAQGPNAGLETRALVWDVDLSELDLNARLYDPATRTYRLQLVNLPAWVQASEERTSEVRVEVTFATPNAVGTQILLEDDFRLRF